MQPPVDKKRNSLPQASHGFTLIELMVVITIAGLIAGIAYPSYQSAIRKAKRAEGRAALMRTMQQQERYYSQNTTYIAFSSTSTEANEKIFKWYSAETPSTSAYELSAAECENESIKICVKLTAKPGTSKVNSSYVDSECGNLTYTSNGIKSADSKNCW
jgi:type IV pilus assembly protein PilE